MVEDGRGHFGTVARPNYAKADYGLADAEFIAAARTAVPALLDALEAAERERDGQRARGDRHNKVANAKHNECQRLREGIDAALANWRYNRETYFALRALLSTPSDRGES